MTNNPTDLVEDAARLTSVFGRWPSFHDAEVVRIVLDRSGSEGPSLEARLHVFEMTDRVGPTGAYVLENHTLVTLGFSGVALERMEDFNHQNVLWDLVLTAIDSEGSGGRRIAVSMASSHGLDATFECTSCKILDVRPFDPAS